MSVDVWDWKFCLSYNPSRATFEVLCFSLNLRGEVCGLEKTLHIYFVFVGFVLSQVINIFSIRGHLFIFTTIMNIPKLCLCTKNKSDMIGRGAFACMGHDACVRSCVCVCLCLCLCMCMCACV
jgi:hypothetical protein